MNKNFPILIILCFYLYISAKARYFAASTQGNNDQFLFIMKNLNISDEIYKLLSGDLDISHEMFKLLTENLNISDEIFKLLSEDALFIDENLLRENAPAPFRPGPNMFFIQHFDNNIIESTNFASREISSKIGSDCRNSD